MSNILTALPTGIGDVARSMLDSVLPKELEFLSGAVGGVIDLETGNLLGAAKNFIDSVLDVKDLVQSQKGPNAGTSSTVPSHPWCYEPPPPPPIGTVITTAKVKALEAFTGAAATTSAPKAATPVDATTLSRSTFLALPDDAFMSAIREGKIPKEIAESKDGMLALQARMTQITEMNQLMTSMLQAIHQLRMGVIQNLRA